MTYAMTPRAAREPEWVDLFEIVEAAAPKGRKKPKRTMVQALFAAATPAIKRAAERDAFKAAAWDGEGEPSSLMMAERGTAYGEALIRYCLRGWRGIGAEGAETPFTPQAVEDFIADERLFEAAYAKFVLPVLIRDMEKNVSSPSPNGTGAGAMAGSDIAS